MLFNCSTNNFGGGVKNSVLFIIRTLEDSRFDWTYAISKEVAELLEKKKVKLSKNFYCFQKSPARNIKARKQLLQIVNKNKCCLVYTMGGPAYVRFPVYHILGLSNGYITHADWSAFKLKTSFFQRIKALLQVIIQIYYSRKADYFVFQTQQARLNFCKRARINQNKSIVITNAYDEEMMKNLLEIPKQPDFSVVQIFCPGGGYIHKGFQFIPAIAKELASLVKIPFRFIVTVPVGKILDQMNMEIERFKVQGYIQNIGLYHYTEVANLFKRADIVFVPSLLETFSVSYLEAMAAKKILIVADKGFAREVCNNAAEYTDPLNPVEAAKILATAILHPEDFKIRIENGQRILKKYGNQQQRFEKIMELLTQKTREIF